MLCIFQANNEGTAWVCQICHHRSRIRNGKPAPIRVCSRLRIVLLEASCPMRAIVSRLTPHGVDHLQLCRVADCGLMVTEENVTRCGRLGKKCDGVAVWSAFLNGDRTCPHWNQSSDAETTAVCTSTTSDTMAASQIASSVQSGPESVTYRD